MKGNRAGRIDPKTIVFESCLLHGCKDGIHLDLTAEHLLTYLIRYLTDFLAQITGHIIQHQENFSCKIRPEAV